MTIRVLTILGTRPEGIKLCPLIKTIKIHPKFECCVVNVAQHREMLDSVLELFQIKTNYDLNIMKEDQDLFNVSAQALIGLREVLKLEKPDVVIVQGDTTTAFIGALAAFYLKIPIGHIEAGLRTNQKYSPFPEEINRHIVSALADYHFSPTNWAKSNLLKEGIPEENIWVTGNTVVDALLYTRQKQEKEAIRNHFRSYFWERFHLALDTDQNKVILVTGHRRENFGTAFENVCFALKDIAMKRGDVSIVYPVHLNPNVQRPVRSILSGLSNVHLLEPLDYEAFVFLMCNSYLVLTDSGGIQEEAPSLGKPVLVMRNTTERPEGVQAQTTRLVGTEKEAIESAVMEMLTDISRYKRMAQVSNPYGDGHAAERIVNILHSKLRLR